MEQVVEVTPSLEHLYHCYAMLHATRQATGQAQLHTELAQPSASGAGSGGRSLVDLYCAPCIAWAMPDGKQVNSMLMATRRNGYYSSTTIGRGEASEEARVAAGLGKQAKGAPVL